MTTTSRILTIVDDEHREPMGLPEHDRCHECSGPVLRTDTPGLCWACMPTASAA